MSAFQPGMANPSIPLFEPDTGIITYIPTPVNLSFPDPIPNVGGLVYNLIPVPQDPQPLIPGGGSVSRLFSVVCSISAANIGNGKAVIVFRIGQAAPNFNDFIYTIPMSEFINSDLPPVPGYLISFTGLVKSLAGQIPKLSIAKEASTDTTDYTIVNIITNFKVL